VQPFDVKRRRGDFAGRMPVEFPATTGNEYAGVVDRVGTGVPGFAPGDEVLDSAAARACADFVVVPAGRLVLPVREYPLTEVVAAHRAVESGHGRDKVVLLTR
jgi:NADPH:quinone reductase-like Zn-dependent oxidoreductase